MTTSFILTGSEWHLLIQLQNQPPPAPLQQLNSRIAHSGDDAIMSLQKKRLARAEDGILIIDPLLNVIVTQAMAATEVDEFTLICPRMGIVFEAYERIAGSWRITPIAILYESR